MTKTKFTRILPQNKLCGLNWSELNPDIKKKLLAFGASTEASLQPAFENLC